MAVTFGLDISHHQPDSLNLGAARAEGCEFVIIKAGEATGADDRFGANLAKARGAGMLAAAYWYQRSSVSAAAHVDGIRRTVPPDVPVIPDVESGSGGVALVHDVVNQTRAAGYRVPLVYLPRWYWQQLGSPSLAGLPPLWSSRYPDTAVGSLLDEWAAVPASYWDGYGGLPVQLLQFTSSARVAGYAPLDANAFRGTRDELAAVLFGGGDGGTTTEEDMIRIPAGGSQNQPAVFSLACSMLFEHDLIIAPGPIGLWLYGVYNWGWDAGTGGNPIPEGQPRAVPEKGAYSCIIPKGTGKIDLAYWSDQDFSATVARRS